jgi:hypothetical protein
MDSPRRRFESIAGLALAIAVWSSSHAHCGMHDLSPASAPEKLGTVSFENSCQPGVKADLNRAVALLHSFWLDEADRTFARVADEDPGCAVAYWGESFSQLHLINAEPSPADLAAGRAALAKADGAAEQTPRETGYLRALHAFYDGYEPARYFEHAQRYAEAMGALAAKYPKDIEAKVLYALGLLAASPPNDVGLAKPREAVAILTPLFREYPDHPGIAHYLIHATDNPGMAMEGLEAARHYALIAPASPHALHMPSHIFARLGLWQDDIRSNLASRAAAERADGRHIGAENRLHAMEFLEYAYLQIGHEKEARQIAEEAKTVRASDVDAAYPNYWATVQSRYPALLAIETRDWDTAAKLAPVTAANTFGTGITLLAHAMAAGYTHNAPLGADAARAYDALLAKEPIVQPGGNYATLHDEIQAWASFSGGHAREALALLRAVAERQRKVGKGEVELPAGEMAADMLLLEGQASAAAQAYELSLQSDPNRFNALFGSAQAAARTGKRDVAQRRYRELIENCAGASGSFLGRLGQLHEAIEATSAGKP